MLVTIGVIVRATDSGLGCPDWPLCHGQLLPPLDDPKAWIEWIHRGSRSLIGFEILGLAVLALRDHRDRRSIVWPSLGAVALVGFQAWLGRETVRLGNSGESVTAHLAAAMLLVGAARLPARPGRLPGADRRPRREPAVHAARGVRGGGDVRAAAVRVARDRHGTSALVFPDWPLMDGTLFPPLTDVTTAHVLHRWVAVVVGVIVVAIAVVAWRTQRDHPTLVRLAVAAAVLFAIQASSAGCRS